MTISTTFEKIKSQLKKPELNADICAYNGDEWILSALESTSKQSLDKAKHEVQFIDNYCTDNSEAIIDEFISKTSEVRNRHIKETKQGLTFARNSGLSEAKSNYNLHIGLTVFALFVIGMFLLTGYFRWTTLMAVFISTILAWVKNLEGFSRWTIENIPICSKSRAVKMSMLIVQLILSLVGSLRIGFLGV